MNSNTGYVAGKSTRHGAPKRLHADGPLQVAKDNNLQQASGLKLRDFGPAVVLFLVSMAALSIAMLSPSGRGGEYGVIAPPWYGLGDTITLIKRADGGIVEMGGPANIAIAHSQSPDFARALYGAGAWLVIDPTRLRGCVGFRQEVQ